MMVALQTLDLTVWSNLKLYNLQKTADYHSAIVYTYYSSSCGFHMKLLYYGQLMNDRILLCFRFMNKF